MSKGEDVMKPDKEQKGDHAMLVIAVGKHPKMGPGKRNYKKDKALKKAFNILKNKKTPTERAKRYEERKARREQRQKEMDAYNAGTASEEVKQKIEQSRANTESGVNQNLRFANKKTGGSQSRTKRMPKKPFDTTAFDRWVNKWSLGSQKGDTNLTDENLKRLAKKIGMNPSSLRAKNFEGVDIGKLKEAMQELGKANYEARKNQRGKSDKPHDSDKDFEEWSKENNPYADDELDEDYSQSLDERFGDKPEKLDMEGMGENDDNNMGNKLLQRLGIDRDRGLRGQELDESDEAAGEGMWDIGRYPSSHTIPFGASGGVEGGRKEKPTRRKGKTLQELGPRGRGGEATFEEEYAGFMPPVTPTRLSNPQEEEDEAEDFPEYGQFATGEPMELAFRLLKNSVCKDNDSCECPKCCENDEDSDKGFLDQCMSCGALTPPNTQCRCGN
jgi:hypothetical protein